MSRFVLLLFFFFVISLAKISPAFVIRFKFKFKFKSKFISWTNHIEGNYVLSPGIWGKVFTDSFKKCSDSYIFSIWYKLIHFSLPLNSAIHRLGNSLTTLCPRCKESDETHTHFLFQCKLSKTTLNFINELINLNYNFQSSFKICIKDILMGTSSHSHDGVKLEILPTLIEVFLRYLSFCQRKAFYEYGYNKIHELSNYKGNLISRFNALRDRSIALGSKGSFLKKWNSLLNINGTLNIKF